MKYTMDRTCRTCLERIPKDSVFFQLDGKDSSAIAMLIKSQLQACVPEVRVGVVKNSIMCSLCLNVLTLAYKFKSRCLETEKHILDYILHAASDITYVDISLVVKRIADISNSAVEDHQREVRSGSSLSSEDKISRKKLGSFRDCKRKYDETEKDYNADISQVNNRVVKKLFSHQSKNGFFNMKLENIEVFGPFSEFMSVDSISVPVRSGIRKNAYKYPESKLKDCIDFYDRSDEEEYSSSVAVHDTDASLSEDSMNFIDIPGIESDSKRNLKHFQGLVEHHNRIEDGPRRVLLNKNLGERNVENKDFCSDEVVQHHRTIEDNSITVLPSENLMEVDIAEDILPSDSNLVNSLNAKTVELEKSSNKFAFIPYHNTEDIFGDRTDALNCKEVPLSALIFVSNTIVPVQKASANNEDVITGLGKSLSLSKEDRTEDSSEVRHSSNSTIRTELNSNDSCNEENCNTNRNDKNINKVVDTNNALHINNAIDVNNVVNTNITVDTPSRKVSSTVTLSAEDALGDFIKNEWESATGDEYKAIEIKDEVLVKDECEFQQYQENIRGRHLGYSCDGVCCSSNKLPLVQNGMNFAELHLKTNKAVARKSSENLPFVAKSNSNEGSICMPTRTSRRRFSCAVCSYSCSSERLMVTHTNVHTGKGTICRCKNHYKFEGFSRTEIEDANCVRCRYSNTSFWSMWIKPEVVLTKWEPK